MGRGSEWSLVLPTSQPGILLGLAKRCLEARLPAWAGTVPVEPSLSGQSLVTLPRGRLWFVTRNTVCSLETLCSFTASVCVCAPICVHVGGFGLKMAKTQNCHAAAALGQGPGSCLKVKRKGCGAIFLCNPQWVRSPSNTHPQFCSIAKNCS